MPRTLLLADDSITIQRVVGITFANEDFEITTVDNGEDAILKAKELKPNIILADVIMPKKNGYEVCQTIRSDPALRSTPVLLLAGTFEAFDENRARAVGANGHITKPFESQALIDKVNSLMGVSAPAPAAQPAPAVSGPSRGVPFPSPLSPWSEPPAASGKSMPSPLQPSAFGQPPRSTSPTPFAQAPRPISTGPQPGVGVSPGIPLAPQVPRPLSPQPIPSASRPLSPQPIPSAPRPLVTPSAPPPSVITSPSVAPPVPRLTPQPIPTVIPPSTAFPSAAPSATRSESLPKSHGGAPSLSQSLFEEIDDEKKAFESQPVEPFGGGSEASIDIEPEPLEPEPLEPEPVEAQSAEESEKLDLEPVAVDTESKPLDALESLEVEGVDTWEAKEDITRPIPTLVAAVESGLQAAASKPSDEPKGKPEAEATADVSFFESTYSQESKSAPSKYVSDSFSPGIESAVKERPFETKPFHTSEPLPEVLPADSIELPSVDIEEEVLADQAPEPIPEFDRIGAAEKVVHKEPLEEHIAAPAPSAAAPKEPLAPLAFATAAAIAATKAPVVAAAAVERIGETQQLSRSELEAIARDTIEKVVWEIVPQLAEAILREEIEKLVQEKLTE